MSHLDIQNERCLAYMDDLIVFSWIIHEHLTGHTEILKQLIKDYLTILPS